MTQNQFVDGMTKVGIAAIAGIVVAVFSFYMARKAYGADKIEAQIKSKVDRSVYDKDRAELIREENAYRLMIDKRMDRNDKMTNDKLDLIIKLIEK